MFSKFFKSYDCVLKGEGNRRHGLIWDLFSENHVAGRSTHSKYHTTLTLSQTIPGFHGPTKEGFKKMWKKEKFW